MKLIYEEEKNYRKAWFFEINESGEYPHLEVSLSVQDGGYNYFTSRPQKKGYYIHVSRVFRREENGYAIVSTMLGNGYKHCLQEIAKKSKKSFDQCISSLDIGTFIAMCGAMGVEEKDALEIYKIIKGEL